MKTSSAMEEIRKIRDENSLRHLSQTQEERSKEMAGSVAWFMKELGKEVKIVTTQKN